MLQAPKKDQGTQNSVSDTQVTLEVTKASGASIRTQGQRSTMRPNDVLSSFYGSGNTQSYRKLRQGLRGESRYIFAIISLL